MTIQKEMPVRFVRQRPLLATVLAVMPLPILMGLWVMATEAAADLRARLARGGLQSALSDRNRPASA